MLVIEQRKCFKLQTFVYVTVLLLMVTYILLGVASLVWFVMIQDGEENVSSHMNLPQIFIILCLNS